MDRRQFFGHAAAAAATTAAACPAQARGNKALPPDAVGLLFDSTLCVGCKACVAACKEANDMPPERHTQDELWDTPLDLSGKTLNVIKVYKQGDVRSPPGGGQSPPPPPEGAQSARERPVADRAKDQETNGWAFVKKSCLHCVDASCVSACPVKAMKKDDKTGVVSHDKNACIGCRYCVAACPFGVPRFTYDRAIPQISKCQLCTHRWPDGHYAACAEVCPTGATLFGKVADIKQEITRRKALEPGKPAIYPRGRLGGPDQSYPGVAARYVSHVYGEKELGGTQMMMLSGVPFGKLGYPALPEESFASRSETLQQTLYGGLVMPVALLGALTWVARRNFRDDEPGGGDEH